MPHFKGGVGGVHKAPKINFHYWEILQFINSIESDYKANICVRFLAIKPCFVSIGNLWLIKLHQIDVKWKFSPKKIVDVQGKNWKINFSMASGFFGAAQQKKGGGKSKSTMVAYQK